MGKLKLQKIPNKLRTCSNTFSCPKSSPLPSSSEFFFNSEHYIS